MTDYDKLLQDYENATFDRKKDILKQLKEKYNGEIIVDDQIPENKDINVCFIFSCPGEREMVAKQVCFGQTGKNLNEVIKLLYEKKNNVFNKTDKSGYYIINASNIVHFEALDGEAEATSTEIKNKSNIERLKRFLDKFIHITYFIFSGKKAELAYECIKGNLTKNQRHVIVCHLGQKGLNNTYKNSYIYKGKKLGDYPEKTRNLIRYKIVAEKIILGLNL